MTTGAAGGAGRADGRGVDGHGGELLVGSLPEAARRAGITHLDLHHVHTPLRSPFTAAHGTESDREVVLVRATADDGAEGWGECDTLSTATYTAEWTAGAFVALRDALGPAALAGDDVEWIAMASAHPMAAAAVELAVVDLTLRRAGRSLAAALGASCREVPAAVVLGRPATVDDLLAAVGAAVEAGAPLVKVKVAPGWFAEPLAAVRAAFADLALAADANGSFAVDDLPDVATTATSLGLAYLEQPVSPTADAALAGWPSGAPPVVVDESVGGPDDVVRIAGIGTPVPSGVNVKPARVGGLRAAMAVVDTCRRTGAPVLVGGMLELGVGRAAAVALAARVADEGAAWPTDVGPSGRYVDADVTEPVLAGGPGTVAVPVGPGIGRTPVAERLDAATLQVATVVR